MLRRIFAKTQSSISAKFLATFLLLLIIPLFIITQLFINRMHTVLKAKEAAHITDKISYAGAQFDRIFSEMDHIVTSLILDYHVTDILSDPSSAPSYDWFAGYKTLNSLLALLNSNVDYKYNITISGYNDKLYYTGAVYNSLLRSDSPILLRIREGNGSPVILNRMLDGYDDNPVVTLGRSVYQKGEYLGSILVDVPVSYLDALLNPFENETTQLFVLEDNSRIIYSSRPTEGSAIVPALETALSAKQSSVRLENTEYLLSQTPAKQNGLSVVTLVTADSVFRESSRVLFTFILAFFAIITATIIGIFILTYTFTRNIRALNAAVSNFGNDPETALDLPVFSPDETGQLAQGFLSMSQRIRRLLRQVQEDERNKRVLEFNSLQAQINPHMIYNTLNTITYLAQVQNVRNIEEISSSFAYLLRSLSNQGEFITIAQEMEYLRSFIAIKKYNLLCSIETDFQIDEAAKDCRILKLLLQPIAENAIIHGFYGQLEDGLLCISARLCENMLSIDISDDGNGMDEERIQLVLSGEEKSSNTFLRVGVRNIMDRLTLQYGERASFSIVSAPGCGTTVHISFPAEKMSENTNITAGQHDAAPSGRTERSLS